MKLAGDPNNPVRIADDASIEELKAVVMKDLERLAPVLDLKALAALSDGVAKREVQVPQGGAANDAGAPHE